MNDGNLISLYYAFLRQKSLSTVNHKIELNSDRKKICQNQMEIRWPMDLRNLYTNLIELGRFIEFVVIFVLKYDILINQIEIQKKNLLLSKMLYGISNAMKLIDDNFS